MDESFGLVELVQRGILSGHEIERQFKLERICISPWDKKYVNPVSYDLTLGEGVRIYADTVDVATPDEYRPQDGRHIVKRAHPTILDSRKTNQTLDFRIGPEGFVLLPGIGYLAHTAETVWTDSFVPIIDGKSSGGRLFIKVHETAGYGDPGFNGQYTLEITVVHPVRVYAGMRICQVRFQSIQGALKLYEGRYRGETAVGAVASRSWEQFDDR